MFGDLPRAEEFVGLQACVSFLESWGKEDNLCHNLISVMSTWSMHLSHLPRSSDPLFLKRSPTKIALSSVIFITMQLSVELCLMMGSFTDNYPSQLYEGGQDKVVNGVK